MWFFMILCYLMTALTFLMLLGNGLQGYFRFAILGAHHATFAVLTIIFYLFTESLIIFYFVGIGVSIKDFVAGNQLSADFHKRSIAVKRKVYPPILLNMLFVMVLFISGGAVDTHRLSGFWHGLLFFVAFIHFIKVICVEHWAFKESTAIVLAMSGVKQ